MNSQKGYTITELLIVIFAAVVFIGVLCGLYAAASAATLTGALKVLGIIALVLLIIKLLRTL